MVAPSLIVNADDLGYDPAITEGILVAARAGALSSATLMVNTPFSARAARSALGAPGLGVGLHLNLAGGESLSSDRALTGPDGLLDARKAPTASPASVAAEARGQLTRFLALMGRPPTHLDLHKHLHRHPGVLAGVAAVALEAFLPVRSIDDAMRRALRQAGVRTNDAFLGETGPAAWWTAEKLLAAIDGVALGVCELMCHPGHAPLAVRSSYGTQRREELAALLDERVLARLRESPPRLCRWDRAGCL